MGQVLMFQPLIRTLAVLTIVAAPLAAVMSAHEMTVRGTVKGIEKARIQIRTGEEKSGEQPAWYPIDSSTKIKRGDKIVTFDEARIKVDERVVIIIDHPDKGPVKTKEIRLAPQ